MKISKASWLILIAGMVFITFASLGIAGARQIQEQQQLGDELTIAERRLEQLQIDQLTTEQDQLVESLAQAAAERETAEGKLRLTNASINVTDFLFEIAQLSGVLITDIKTTGLSSGDLNDIPCAIQSINTRAEGEVLDLIAFVTELNKSFTNGVVQSVNMAITEDEGLPTVNILISVYTYESE